MKAGVGWPLEYPNINTSTLASLGVKTMFDWSMDHKPAIDAPENGIEFLPMQWGCKLGTGSIDEVKVEAFAKAFPGSRWLIFNEPDNISQANCGTWHAAVAFHKIQSIVRAHDLTAKLYICGTSFYPAHIEYLRQMTWNYKGRYGCLPQVDGVHFHSYATNFADRFNWRMLQEEALATHYWLESQPAFRGKPVIISEYGVLSGSWYKDDAKRIADEFLPIMFEFWENQSWVENHLWFSTYYNEHTYQPSNLFNLDGSLTVVGKSWKRLAANA